MCVCVCVCVCARAREKKYFLRTFVGFQTKSYLVKYTTGGRICLRAGWLADKPNECSLIKKQNSLFV